MTHKTNLLIVGGGIIGTAIAEYMSKRGLKVTLLEKNALGQGCTKASAGYIFLQTKKPGIHLELAKNSISMFENYPDSVKNRIGYRSGGGLLLIENEEQLSIMTKVVSQLKNQGVSVEIINQNKLKTIQPSIKDKAIAATYCTNDRYINPLSYLAYLKEEAEYSGVDLREGVTVYNFISEGEYISAVETDHGKFIADYVIITAGYESKSLAGLIGIRIPLKPLKGQFSEYITNGSIISIPTLESRYLANKFGYNVSFDCIDPDVLFLGCSLGIVQQDNRVYISTTREICDTDLVVQPTAKATKVMLENAKKFFSLDNITWFITRAGIRPISSDGLPIISKTRIHNLLLATGHGGDGISLAPMTAVVICELLENKLESSLEKSLSVNRFE